jgi:FlaA1/EpsC-like NDP-sugar epimerase
MDIQNKTVLVLGAWGLVGNAITRKLLTENPKQIIVTSLNKEEAESYADQLRKEFPDLPNDYFIPWWGNIFVREEFKDTNRFEILNDPVKRKILMKDIMEEMTPDVLEASALYNLIEKHKPDIIIDSINSATGIAYQDVYTTYHTITKTIQNNPSKEALAEETEKFTTAGWAAGP